MKLLMSKFLSFEAIIIKLLWGGLMWYRGSKWRLGLGPYKPDIVANKAIPPHLTDLKRKYIINSRDLHFFYLNFEQCQSLYSISKLCDFVSRLGVFLKGCVYIYIYIVNNVHIIYVLCILYCGARHCCWIGYKKYETLMEGHCAA